MEELAAILGEELALPRIEPRGKKNIVTTKDKYTGIRQAGPESLRHFKRTFKRALKRQIASAVVRPRSSRSSCRSGTTSSIAAGKKSSSPQAVAVIIYMMDVSGSMTDEQKEIVRIEAFWIDTWIKAHYQGVENVYIIHDAAAQEVDEHTFYHTRESGGTKISSAYDLCDKIIDARYPAGRVEHLRLPLLRRRQLGRRHPALHRDPAPKSCCPSVNLFGYGQVESPYGSGEFYRIHPRNAGRDATTWCASRIPDRDAILGSIKEFLGTGLTERTTDEGKQDFRRLRLSVGLPRTFRGSPTLSRKR